MRMYNRAVYGDLLELNILDTRQYRSLPPVSNPTLGPPLGIAHNLPRYPRRLAHPPRQRAGNLAPPRPRHAAMQVDHPRPTRPLRPPRHAGQ
jgi:hypothetical protein